MSLHDDLVFRISEEKLEEYKRLFKKHFGRELSNQEARESATKLLTMVRLVYKPLKKEWLTEEEIERLSARECG